MPISAQRQADMEALQSDIHRFGLELAEKKRDQGAQVDEVQTLDLFQRQRYLDELQQDLHDLIALPEAPAEGRDPADLQPLAAPKGLAIIIGHSPEGDRGASGITPPFPAQSLDGKSEYYWNKDLAERIVTKVQARGIRVAVFHRMQNGGVGIRDAYRRAKEWNPLASVELHFNSADNPARGTETLFGTQQSKPWAQALQDKMVALYHREGRQNRGIKDANAAGRGVQSLTTSVQPSALIEPFFAHVTDDATLGMTLKDGLAAAIQDAFLSMFPGEIAGPQPAESSTTQLAGTPWANLRQAASETAIEFPHLKGIAFAQWALESGRGSSSLATWHKNFAGMKWREFMGDLATKVWHQAHDGGEFYCKFDTLEKFIAGYWARLERHPSYAGWQAHTATPEMFLRYIGDKWAPPSENPSYVPKVLAIYERMKADGSLPDPGEPAIRPAARIAAEQREAEIPSDEDFWLDRTEEEVLADAIGISPEAARSKAAREADVKWAADKDAFDYAHLESDLPAGMQFAFGAADLELLCRLNDFPVEETGERPVLFGLRGAAIVAGGSSGDGAFRDEVVLKDQRPNHRDARCVMGVWDRKQARVAVYPGSTVPNAAAVVNWFSTREAGNTLPTGLYRYVCGVHNRKPGCFLLRQANGERRKVIVRRTADDLVYEDVDVFQNMAPGDNIHPTFSQEQSWFSSLGCQVVVGSADPSGNHSGPWARFRKSAGFSDANGEPGAPFLYVLLTGHEALIASELRKSSLTHDPVATRRLRRLRFGSSGSAVTALQTKLGLTQPDGDLGPMTAETLHLKQKSLSQGRSDGIFTPKLGQGLGWDVLGPLDLPLS